MTNINLNTQISELKGVGKTLSKKLNALGLKTVYDLIFYFPFRYDDFSRQVKIDDLKEDKNVSLVGTIELIQNKKSWRQKKYITEALVSDDSGTIKVVWFNQAFLTKTLQTGDTISLAGKVKYSYGQLTLVSPQYEKISQGKINTFGLVPVYSLSSNLTQKQMRFFVSQVIDLAKKIPEWLPKNLLENLNLMPLSQAVFQIHFPESKKSVELARQRLEFGELFLRQIKTLIAKNNLKKQAAFTIDFKESLTKEFVDKLAFTLTNDQKKAAWEIISDLKKGQTMSRLLEGDVGSGKTIVAAIAILNVVKNDYKCALMAPTEILARQHFHTLKELFKNYSLKISLLLSKALEANFPLEKSRKKQKEKIYSESDIIIGTHSLLFQKHPEKLALAIIDEQHRFGVTQRQYLSQNKQEKTAPHFLSLTATPIPRSLALAFYGDLDLSIIKEQPKGRKKIITEIISEEKRDQAYNFIKEKLDLKQQAFVVCPLIENSQKLEVKSAKEELKRLKEQVFPEYNLGLLHGRLKSQEKEKVMKDFLDKKIDILVSTSVVEVGIDIKNASIMMIEGAERFGLAQLHQFRGRVGRGDTQSYCFLFTSQEIKSEKTFKRLSALSQYHDGLSLAKIDLDLRGSGDIYGKLQSGFSELRLASLFDYELIKKTREEAEKIINKDPELKNNPTIKEKLGTWERNIHLE